MLSKHILNLNTLDSFLDAIITHDPLILHPDWVVETIITCQ